MKKGIRRAICALLTVSMVFSTACGDGGSTGTGGSAGGPAEGAREIVAELSSKVDTEETMVYTAEAFNAGTKESTAYWFMREKNGVLYYGIGQRLMEYPLGAGRAGERELKAGGVEGAWDTSRAWEINQISIGEDGSLYSLAKVYLDEKNEEGGWKSKYYLSKFAVDGTMIYAKEMTEYTANENEARINMWTLETDSMGRCYLAGQNFVWLFDETGAYQGSVAMSDAATLEVKAISATNGGKVYVAYTIASARSSYLAEIDFEGKRVLNVYKMPAVEGIIVGGNGGEDDNFLIYDDTSCYSCDLSGASFTPIFQWTDCNMEGGNVKYAKLLEDGRVFVSCYSRQFGGETFLINAISESDASPAKKTNITLGMVLNHSANLKEIVVQFNRNNDKYNVTIKDYSNGMALADAKSRLSGELMAGNAPDLIDVNFEFEEELSKMGGVEDLRPYLEKSQVLSVDDFLEAVVAEYTVGDRLVAIPYSFNFSVMMSYRDIVGDEPGWTLEEMLDAAEAHPDMDVYNDYFFFRKRVLFDIMYFSASEFLDWESGTCNFDNNLFRRTMELLKEVPSGILENNVSVYTNIKNMTGLIVKASVNRLRDLQPYKDFYGGDVTYIGYPNPEGVVHYAEAEDAFMINSQSQNKEGAWAFLEYLLSYQREGYDEIYQIGFSANKNILESYIEACLNAPSGLVTSHFKDVTYEYPTVTQDIVDDFYEILENVRFNPSSELDVVNIIMEEAESYFAGQKLLEEVSRIIQNRVQLYMDENKK